MEEALHSVCLAYEAVQDSARFAREAHFTSGGPVPETSKCCSRLRSLTYKPKPSARSPFVLRNGRSLISRSQYGLAGSGVTGLRF